MQEENEMIRFILGTIIVSTLGVITMCLCAAAGEYDRRNGMK
ncbi:Protein of unknown function [Ruminococcaceae bacterium FB2012]|nr:Protein of unknown function [Ruminococcaceae bacterium FB2012]